MVGYIFSLFLNCVAIGQPGKLIDRLVIEVNGTTYTQRYVTMYSTVRNVLKPEIATLKLHVNEKTWAMILEQFRDEMIVEQEAQRLGTVQPNNRMVSKLRQTFDLRRKQFPIVSEILAEMVATPFEIDKILSSIIRVQGFYLMKRRQESTSNRVIGFESEWFGSLRSRTSIRIFEGANRFLPISPLMVGSH